ncbi:hypothetical protein KAH27_00010 [bacterium]|nr:hypothetical protein [bacterium]
MKKLFYLISLLILMFTLSSCIQQDVEESEFTVQADGRIFERSVKLGLVSDCKSTNEAIKDLKKLIDHYEPPIISPTLDKDVKGRTILRRELIRRSGQLDTLEEAIYPDGFKTERFQELLSNGFLWLPLNTNGYVLETNGDIAGDYDEKGMVLVKWPTNTTTLWFKKKRSSTKGFNLLDFYDNALEVSRTSRYDKIRQPK